MAGFLSGLGAFAEGFAPGLDKLYQQQSDNALGNALADIYGGGQAAPQQSAGPLGSISTLLKGLGGGGQPQAPQAPMMPAMQQPPAAQMGARMPQPQPQAPPQIVQAPQPPPPVAQPGVQTPGVTPQIAPQMQAQAPQPQPQPQVVPRPQPPAQQQQPQGQQGTGPLDIPTLVRSLTAHGITGHKLVDALHTAVPLLNAQGLAQYRDLGLQLRREEMQNREVDREFNRDPNAPGSRAQSRVANQGLALQRMEGIQQRFQTRMAAAADKIANAKTDKDMQNAMRDKDRVATDLKNELASELAIANSLGTPPEEQKAALAKAAEIRQQMEQGFDEAIKARRSAGANGDQVGGVKGSQKAPTEVVPGKQVHQVGETRTFNGQTYHYIGGDWDAQESWAPGQ